MKNFKIRTYGSRALSHAIQTKLFSLGVGWCSSGKTLEYYLHRSFISVINGELFNHHDKYSKTLALSEITIDELFKMEKLHREAQPGEVWRLAKEIGDFKDAIVLIANPTSYETCKQDNYPHWRIDMGHTCTLEHHGDGVVSEAKGDVFLASSLEEYFKS